MADNIITNANDVDLIIQSNPASPSGEKRGTADSMGRIVVDDFSISKEEDDSLVSGVGHRLPGGITYGDITFGYSFTLQGEDVSLFEMVANERGESNIFSFTAQKTEDDGTMRWQVSLGVAISTSEEWSGTSGDPMEYSVDGIGFQMDKQGVTESGSTAWG